LTACDLAVRLSSSLGSDLYQQLALMAARLRAPPVLGL